MIITWLITHRWPAVLAAAYLVLAVAYGLANPPFEATDEIRHFRYIRYIALHHALPPISVESSKDLQAHHPPLYYAAAAILTASIPGQVDETYTPPINPFWGFRYFEPSIDNKNQYLHDPNERWPFTAPTNLGVYMARWLSTILGLGTVLMTYRLGRSVCPEQTAVALGAMAFVGFNPTLLHSAASVNNDMAAAFFGSWAVTEAAAVAGHQADRWTAARFGLALGLGLMSKVSVGVLGAVALAAWLAPLKGGWRRAARDAAIVAALVALIAGWWFARNYLASGDLMGFSDYQSAWLGEADRARLIREAISGLPYAWTTVWARLDYGQIVLPDWTYALWSLAALAAGAGLLRAGRRAGRSGLRVAVAAVALSLAGWAILMVTIPATAHARHVLYAFPAIGLLFALGWHGLWPRTSRLVWAICAGSLGFALYTLVGFLAPAFAYPLTVPEIPPGTASAAANFEGAAELVGYTISSNEVLPGGRVDVTVFWKPLAQTPAPVQVFVHFVDGSGIIAAQRDTYPGLGNAPTTSWRAGQVFADTYRVYLPDTVYAPETLTVRVGLWQTAESRPLLTGDSDSLALGTLALRPRAGDLPNPLGINFDNTAQLVGYDLDNRVLAPGGTLQLQTFWRISNRLDRAYWAYAHVVGNDGRIWALADSVVLPFTTGWDPGRTNGETRPITLARDTPPGQYTLEFGLTRVEEAGQYRLPVLAADGHGLGDHVDLARIRVEP